MVFQIPIIKVSIVIAADIGSPGFIKLNKIEPPLAKKVRVTKTHTLKKRIR